MGRFTHLRLRAMALSLAGAALLMFTAAGQARANILVFTSEAAWEAAVHGTIAPPGTLLQTITTQILPGGIAHPPGTLTTSSTNSSTVSLDNGFLAFGPTTPTEGRRDTKVDFAREVAGFGGIFNADPISAEQRFYVADSSFIPVSLPGFTNGGFLGIVLDRADSVVDFPNLPADVFPDEPYASEWTLTKVAMAVDEPGSAALLLLGLGALALIARRGRRHA